MALGETLATATLLGAVVNAVLVAFVWSERDQPGARIFVVLLGLEIAWCLLSVAVNTVSGRELTRLFDTGIWGVGTLIPVAWVAFALAYTGRDHLLTRRNLAALLVLPSTTVPMLLTNDVHRLAMRNFHVVHQGVLHPPSFDPGPWLVVVAVFSFFLIGAGLLMFLEFFAEDRYGTQALALSVAAVLPGTASVKRVMEAGPYPLVDLTPLAFAVSGAILGLALFQYDLFRQAPAVRRVGQRAAIDDFGDGVVIVDDDRRVIDLNATARRLLETGDELVNRPVDELFGTTDLDLEDIADAVRIETNRGRREFDLTVSPIADRGGRRLGHTIVLHDITDEKQRRQRLEVLNRILRHNLRNTMTAIIGYARRLQTHADEEGAWMTERIEQQSADLVALSEKAREIDLVTDPSRPQERFEISEALEGVRRRLTTDHDRVMVTVTVPGTLTMTTDRVILEEVLRYAATVMLSYNDMAEPRIVLSATPTDSARPWIDLTITSNGDPVPVEEREVIERGEETPLEHSRDLELWLVAWGVETLGGDLSYVDDGERPGISLSVPDFERATDGSGDELWF